MLEYGCYMISDRLYYIILLLARVTVLVMTVQREAIAHTRAFLYLAVAGEHTLWVGQQHGLRGVVCGSEHLTWRLLIIGIAALI